VKKVLVAVDTGREGGNDLIMETANTLTDTMGGELHVLHVIEPIPKRIAPELPKEALARRKIHAEAEMSELQKHYGFANGALREGPPSNEILRYAAEIEADLIVLHSHDPNLSDYFIGSVAGRVVRRAHCSVHIVRVGREKT